MLGFRPGPKKSVEEILGRGLSRSLDLVQTWIHALKELNEHEVLAKFESAMLVLFDDEDRLSK